MRFETETKTKPQLEAGKNGGSKPIIQLIQWRARARQSALRLLNNPEYTQSTPTRVRSLYFNHFKFVLRTSH